MAIFSLSVIGTIAAFSPFDHIQAAAAQQENNNSNSNNTKLFSLSTISTTIGTGAGRYWSYSNSTGLFKDKKAIKIPGYIFTKNP